VQNAEEIAVSNEFERHVAKAMDELPEKLRQALVLAAIQGYTTKEVADLLDLPEGTIKSRVHLARKQMAEKLAWLVKDTNRD
jgi:RNA polymerase sigma-70 factor (ECF subfamily)